MASKLFQELLAEVKPETTIFIKKYLDLVERINELMEERNMSQKDLSQALEQQPSAVSRMLNSDSHNMTLRSIAKLEAFFGQDILVVKGRENAHPFTFEMENKKQIVTTRIVHIDSERNKAMKNQNFKIGTVIHKELQIAEAI
jgi:transcriptional regulator with XRE-family HTH domain